MPTAASGAGPRAARARPPPTERCWTRRGDCSPNPDASSTLGGGVLLIGDGLEPRGAVAVGCAFEHGDVAHHVVSGSAVPVLLARWGPHGVAGAHPDDGAVAARDHANAFGDVQGLTVGVRVPVRACAGGEAD